MYICYYSSNFHFYIKTWSIKSAKYELPIYNFTNKTKYAIGSIHLIAMTEGLLNKELKERLTANISINLQGGKNNNMALDEYVELLNRDSKIACSGFQTKESIIAHSVLSLTLQSILMRFVR